MRNELTYIQLIEKYLLNKLSDKEKQEFETRLKTDNQLKKDVEKQKLVMEGAKRMGLKASAQKGFKKFKTMKNLKYIATTIAVIGAATMLYFAMSNKEVKTNSPEELLPEQGFVIDNAKDTVIETENGMVLVIPENAFVDEKGNAITNVNFEVKEAFETADILKAGLTTLSDGRLLETGGMFFLNAYDNEGNKLALAQDKKILAEIPNMNPREDMMLFDGEKQEDGSINWVNPKPFEKDLITYDITTLDFYPEGYLEELKYKKVTNYNGRELFKQNCSSCHHPTTDMTGPALKGVKEKWKKAGDDVFKYVKNPQAQYDAGVKTALGINYFRGGMPGQAVNDEEIAAILAYADNYPASDHEIDTPADKLVKTNINTNDKQFTDSLYYCFARLFEGDDVAIADTNSSLLTTISSDKEIGFIDPIRWRLFTEKISEKKYKVIAEASLDEKWKLFSSQMTSKNGPFGLEFNLNDKNLKLVGQMREKGNLISEYDNDFNMDVKYYTNTVKFEQIVILENDNEEISGNINYMLCDEYKCLPPDNIYFTIINKESDNAPVTEAQSCTPKGINPARIQAIWNKEFNNTILATKEFETRLRVIHQTHNDALLNVYVSNINKPLWYCDSVASTMAGSYKSQFEAFYKQKKGGVKVSDKLTAKLSKYYEKKQKDVTEKSAQAYQEFEARKQKLINDFSSKKTEKDKEEFNRKMKVFNEELVINLDEAYRQIGKKRAGGVGSPFVASVGLGPKNLDAYVFESTANRTTLDYTDPETGKKAVIKYEEASVKVLNTEKFDRIFVYMIPDTLSSFNRMKTTDKINFKNTLNEFINYKMVCLGYVGEQAYYYESGLEAKHYEVTLAKLSEEELKQKLNKNKSTTKKDIIADVDFYKEEVAFKKAKDKIKATEELTVRIGKFLFPSLDEGCFVTYKPSEVVEDYDFSSW